jgi:hypothetical protein
MKIHQLVARYLTLAERSAGLLLLAFASLGALALWLAAGLELRTDMADLLPQDHPTVQALRRTSARQRSATSLVLLIGSPDPAANERFAEALRPRLLRLVPAVFSELQLSPDPEVPDFQRRWRWLYASLDDLHGAGQLLDRLLAARSSPLYVDLEGDAEAELRALRARLSPGSEPPPARFAGISKETGLHHVGLLLWRRGGGVASASDQEALRATQEQVDALRPASFHPALRVEFTGPIAMALDEQRAILQDLTLATVLCVGLVLLSIHLYFRRVALLPVLIAPALLGLLLTLALTRLALGALNANTAFLISIILGNGINAPIVLIACYNEERRRGAPSALALAQALRGALHGTATATAAASIAYGCLLLAPLPGLSQFGLVGGLGMLLTWAMTFLCTPPLLLLGERLVPRALTPPGDPSPFRAPFLHLGRAVARRPRAVLLMTGALTALALFSGWRYGRDPAAWAEWDMNRLRSEETEAQRRWAVMYELGLGNVGAGHIGTDAVLLVDDPAQAEPVAAALLRADRAGARLIKEVRTLRSILPGTAEEQRQKLLLLSELRDRIDQLLAKDALAPEERAEALALRPPDDLREITPADLPRQVREAFSEIDGTLGRLIGIDADPARFDDWNGHDLLRLSQALTVEALGKTWIAGSPATLFARMLEIIQRDGPRVTAAAAAGVALLVLCSFGPRGALPVLLCLGAGVAWLAGLLGALSLRLNFLNFVALPLTLGIGTDYAANLFARARRAGPERLAEVVADTGSAVALCSLTTVIGYSALLLGRSRALQSFGWIANLGEITCLAAALVVLPALLRLRGRRR